MRTQPNGLIDRRRPRLADQSATEMLADFSTLVLLERLPVPVLAVRDDGGIAFANDAFASMVGHSRRRLTSMDLAAIVTGRSRAATNLRALANSLVELAHAEGWMVPTAMSVSMLRLHDDSLGLATFVDLTEQVWIEGDISASAAAKAANYAGGLDGITFLPAATR